METTNPHSYIMEVMNDDYMSWMQFQFQTSATNLMGVPFSVDNSMPTNSDFLQYIHHPSDPPSQYYQQQYQNQLSSMEEEDDDDDSLDCSISTPHQHYFPAFDQAKVNDSAHDLQQRHDTHHAITFPSTSASSKPSSLDLASANLPMNFLDQYVLGLSRSYVSLSDVNAFVAQADSIKHSTSTHSGGDRECRLTTPPSSLCVDSFPSSVERSSDDDTPPINEHTPYDSDQYDDDDDDTHESFPPMIRTKKSKRRHTIILKKSRNVDKACNHCKHSHLRCDEMRPCRRCISTGKSDCQDVQHKPRGRPKLHRK